MASRFLLACRCQPVDRTPVWFMRQAGRWLPEYRVIRRNRSLADIYATPTLAADLSLLPLHRIDADAALVFTDPLLPLGPAGIPLTEQEAGGMGVARALTSAEDIVRLKVYDAAAELGHLAETVSRAKRALQDGLPLVGLAAAPFTLAAYALEGGRAVGGAAATRALMHGDPPAWQALMEKMTEVCRRVLRLQIEAGVDAVQVFDSWAGALDAREYREHVLRYSRRVFDEIASLGVPSIHVGLRTDAVIEALRDAGGDVIGIDARVPLDEAWARIGFDRGIQGNLDATVLLRPFEEVLAAASDVLDRAARRPGHIFSLGHGLLPSTPVEHVEALVRYVHTHSARS